MKQTVWTEIECPSCGKALQHDVRRGPRSPTQFACEHCESPVYIHYDRRGGLYINGERTDAWRNSLKRFLEAPSRNTFPIIWTPSQRVFPDGGVAPPSPGKKWKAPPPPGRVLRKTQRTIYLAGSYLGPAEERMEVRCRCLDCHGRLTAMVWPRSQVLGKPPLAGILVLDSLLADRQQALAPLDRFLREGGSAAALLVCRRCKTQNAFILRGHRSEGSKPLADLLRIVDN